MTLISPRFQVKRDKQIDGLLIGETFTFVNIFGACNSGKSKGYGVMLRLNTVPLKQGMTYR